MNIITSIKHWFKPEPEPKIIIRFRHGMAVGVEIRGNMENVNFETAFIVDKFVSMNSYSQAEVERYLSNAQKSS